MASNAAFYHHPEGVATDGRRLMGRHVAGAGFLAGYARHAGVDRLFAYARDAGHFADFERRVRAANPMAPPASWIRRGRLGELAGPGCLAVPSPEIGALAWLRRHGDQRGFSLSGLFHTTASDRAMDAIGDLAIAPLQAWDAVVCPSLAVRRTVEHVLERWSDYLASVAGAPIRPVVQLPVIPLGVDASAFAPSPASRAEWRARLGVADDEPVVLYVGRLSYHAKANPFAMLVALEDAAARLDRAVRLVLVGWFASPTIEAHVRRAIAALCRRVRVDIVDGRDEDARVGPWHAADVFVSLVDNVQETFGLSPLEAMASGLPIVASDWDGYRETVRHGIDGFLVPTLAPPAGAGAEIAFRHVAGIDGYDRAIGGAAQSVAVDIGATRDAFVALLGDADLRRRMSEAGRARALAEYDWRVVVARTQGLWTELAERRGRDLERAARGAGAPAHPLRDDPFAAFAHYPTSALALDVMLERVPGQGLEDAGAVSPLVDFAPYLLPSRARLERALDTLDDGPRSVGDLVTGLAAGECRRLLRGLAWLAKIGAIRWREGGPR
ncbi:MAG: glycosyltransferase family 4 protein [Alphaproteobacteria bacterium]